MQSKGQAERGGTASQGPGVTEEHANAQSHREEKAERGVCDWLCNCGLHSASASLADGGQEHPCPRMAGQEKDLMTPRPGEGGCVTAAHRQWERRLG